MRIQTLASGVKKLSGSTYWTDRIPAELDFVERVTDLRGGKADERGAIGEAAAALAGRVRVSGAMTREAEEECERALAPLAAACKEYKNRR